MSLSFHGDVAWELSRQPYAGFRPNFNRRHALARFTEELNP
ncbi:MAG: hypothetical protein ACR2NZ_00815 [Rubripirellula sp.]